MPISFTCPHCGESMVIDDHYAGASGPCRACQRPITIPNPIADDLLPSRRASWLDVSWLFGLAGICAVILVFTGIVYLLGWASRPVVPGAGFGATTAASNVPVDQLEQIHMALLGYYADHGTLPPAYTVDDQGQPLHSWRVLILPYLEERELYDRLDLSQPWDSARNKPLLDRYAPTAFVNSLDTTNDGQQTNFVVVSDASSMFPPGQGRLLHDVNPPGDSLADRVMVLEVRSMPIPWAKPMDLTMDEAWAQYQNSSEGVAVLRMSGDVGVIPPHNYSQEQFELLLTAPDANVSADEENSGN